MLFLNQELVKNGLRNRSRVMERSPNVHEINFFLPICISPNSPLVSFTCTCHMTHFISMYAWHYSWETFQCGSDKPQICFGGWMLETIDKSVNVMDGIVKQVGPILKMDY